MLTVFLGASSVSLDTFCVGIIALRKKVKPKRLHPGAVLENGTTLEGGAVFPK